FCYSYGHHRDLHSFPTRRSSDLSKGSRKQDQFVANIRNGDETRSIVSRVNYRQFSLAMRANYFLTPTLSVQYYGEPFIFRGVFEDRKSTRLNSSHVKISYAVFCL